MTQDNKWEIVRKGDIYCDPGCGRGCTHAEYCRAVVDSEELLSMLEKGWLGKGWTTSVWDNLGWHYSVKYRGDLVVRYFRDGTYYASIGHQYHSSHHDDPNDAVTDSVGKLSDAIIDLMDKYERVTESKFE